MPSNEQDGRSVRQATAGGRASSGGTRFHASAATAVYAAILSGSPLPWFGLTTRVPRAVQAESGGGGDDLKIEFGATVSEVQVRHRMNAARKLTELVDDIARRTRGKSASPVALVAGRHDSSAKLFTDVRRDLGGLRAHVEEARLTEPVVGLLADPDRRRVLESRYIVNADFDDTSSPDRENATADTDSTRSPHCTHTSPRVRTRPRPRWRRMVRAASVHNVLA